LFPIFIVCHYFLRLARDNESRTASFEWIVAFQSTGQVRWPMRHHRQPCTEAEVPCVRNGQHKFLRNIKLNKKSSILNILKRSRGPGAQDNSASQFQKASGIISNQLPLDLLKIPPTVLLMDSLNTQTPNQGQGRAKMIQLLRGLPPDTPVAVFLVGSSLRILQGFTSDGKLLRAALAQSLVGNSIQQDPRNDLGDTSNYILNTTTGSGANQGLAAQVTSKLSRA